ncbi:hypothetical protein MCHI_003828 [Candidatus Magnetoovum chiemensis]|nr:hypothetical protein MCHI_003828 [Candidatus Magnetoovum chiemensis]
MLYLLVDRIISDVDSLIKNTTVDEFIITGFAGLLTVNAVAAFEDRVKKCLYDFSNKIDPVFGNYFKSRYDKINAKVKTSDLIDNYLKHFGNEYKERFNTKLKIITKEAINSADPVEQYNNFIQKRHDFVHKIKLDLEYAEAKKQYYSGKKIIEAFESSLMDTK